MSSEEGQYRITGNFAGAHDADWILLTSINPTFVITPVLILVEIITPVIPLFFVHTQQG